MAAPTRTTITDRLFDGVDERQAMFYDTIRSAADRYHRFNRSILEGARQSSRDWTEVARRFVNTPTDLIGIYEAAAEAVGNQQARALALTREWLEDRVEAQRETREVIRQSFGDVREAVERAQQNAPEFLRRAVRRSNGSRERAAATAEE